MTKAEFKRFLSIMEFIYGFLFGASIFAGGLTFLLAPDFFTGILLGVCVFSVFLFLVALIRYFIIRLKLSFRKLELQIESNETNALILQTLNIQSAKILESINSNVADSKDCENSNVESREIDS